MSNVLHLEFGDNASDLSEAKVSIRAASYREVRSVLDTCFTADGIADVMNGFDEICDLIEALQIDGETADIQDVEHVAAQSILGEVLAFLADPTSITKSRKRPTRSRSQAKGKASTRRKSSAS